jgi:maltooligosyltrehalose trehalohydrolase
VPDPQDPQTFADSKLPWNELAEPDHADTLDFYQRLIGLRRDRPELTDPRLTDVRVRFDEEARWLVLLRGRVAVVCNLAAERQTVPIGSTPVEMLLASAPGFVYAGEEVELDGESTAIVALPNA